MTYYYHFLYTFFSKLMGSSPGTEQHLTEYMEQVLNEFDVHLIMILIMILEKRKKGCDSSDLY
jgi:hypothetical protein